MSVLGIIFVCLFVVVVEVGGRPFLSLTSAFRNADDSGFFSRTVASFGGADPTCTGSAKRFEGAEHRCAANADKITLLDPGNDTAITFMEVDIWKLVLYGANGVRLGTFGDVVAMAGDFFAPDNKNEIICLGPTPEDRRARFYDSVSTMDQAQQPGVDEIIQEFDNELAGIKGKEQTTIVWQVYRKFSFAKFLFTLAAGSLNNTVFAKQIFDRLVANFDHFGTCGQLAYGTGHFEACTLAETAGNTVRSVFNNMASTAPQRQAALSAANSSLIRAYFLDAFSLHFLSDQFAAGHLRTPRAALVNQCADTPGGLLANYQHDEENRNGLHVVNRLGKKWISYGDSNVFDVRNLENLQTVHSAIHASRVEVVAAFQGLGVPSIGNETALLFVPEIDENDPANAQQCPLFRVNNVTGSLEVRDDIIRTSDWIADLTAIPPFDASVATCKPVNTTALKLVGCSYRVMTNTDCPGTGELAFAKQSFADPSLFGARILCFDEVQRAYIAQYGVNSLSAGQIAGIVIGCVVFAVLVGIGIFFLVQKCCIKATESSDMSKVVNANSGATEMTNL